MIKLDDAIQLAIETHKGQVDKGGNPYILHALRVLCNVEYRIRHLRVKDRESVLCSAVLHDCIEDAKNSDEIRLDIRYKCGDIVEKQVDTLTRRKPESWKNYISRVENYWAPRIIKIADLEDNLDITRLKEVTEDDSKRNMMYATTLRRLR